MCIHAGRNRDRDRQQMGSVIYLNRNMGYCQHCSGPGPGPRPGCTQCE